MRSAGTGGLLQTEGARCKLRLAVEGDLGP